MGWCRVFLAALLPLTAARLDQSRTNGKSVLGTDQAPQLPQFLADGPLSHGTPWGSLTANGTNPYKTHPRTGKIRSYDFTISRGTLAPDGYAKSMLLVNGQFPGPIIEANWGDTIQVTLHNNITGPEEGTSLHWHGFLQQGTPWEDGVPAVSQCPVAPGTSFTYQFQATLYGTTWYHSHYSGQYGDGAVGPIVVYGPNQYPYDVDVGPVLLSDWYHDDYLTLLERMLAPGGSPIVPSDSNLIQGKGSFNCSAVNGTGTSSCTEDAGLSMLRFEPGKTHRLRLVNTGAEAVQQISIDNHTMKVIAYDFVPIEAYETTHVVLGVGQRADVLVTADANTGPAAAGAAFWLRSTMASCSATHQPDALAIVYYNTSSSSGDGNKYDLSPPNGVSDDSSPKQGHGASANYGRPLSPSSSGSVRSTACAVTIPTPSSQPWPGLDAGVCANDDLAQTRPLFPITPAPPTWTHTMGVGLERNASNVTLWTFDGVSFRGDYNAPTLLLADLGNTTWKDEWNARNLYSNTSVRLVVNNDSPASHPMHLHGSNFYVLHEGAGPWDGDVTVNGNSPMRRDVQLVRPHGHLVLQFDATNPGVWPFHCHIAWHASGGFFAQFVVQPEQLRQLTVPGVVAQTCRDWAAWTGTHVPDQIDSGL